MQITKKTQTEQTDRKTYVGLENFQVVAVNPTIQELNKLYEREDKDTDKEIEYVSERDGADRVCVAIFLKGIQTNRIVRKNFYIIDRIRMSKDGLKTQWVNNSCEGGWGATEDDLTDFFKNFIDKKTKAIIGKKSIRPAMEGEVDLYRAIRGIMNKVKYSDVDTDIRFDFKKMLKGNFKELQSYLGNDEYCGTICLVNYVKNVDGEDGAIKTYNEVYFGENGVLPADFYAKVANSTNKYYSTTLEQIKGDEEEFRRLKIGGMLEALTIQDIAGYVKEPNAFFKNEYEARIWKKFSDEVNGEYGIKGFYKLYPVFEYSPNMDITSNKNVVATDSSY